MVEGGTPNTLLRRGITRDSLAIGTEIVVDGYQTRDHSLTRANGRNVTFPDGRKLFLGSSGTGAPTDGADPTEAPKGRGRGGAENVERGVRRVRAERIRLRTLISAPYADSNSQAGDSDAHSILTLVAVMAAAIVAVSIVPVDVAGQAGAPVKNQTAGAVPRTADGHPDLQGTYDLATLTPVERRPGTPLVLTDEQAAKLEKDVAKRTDALAAPIKADRDAPPKGGDGSPGPYGNVGGYNNFWLDPGSQYTTSTARSAPRSSSIRLTAACRR